MTPYQVLELIALDIEPGTRSRVLCPKCGGGDAKETSLSLFVDHSKRIAWKCFRAKCGYAGSPRGVSGPSTKVSSAPKYFTAPYAQCTRDTPEGAFLYERFHISLVDVYWCDEQRRFVLPIVGPTGNRRGTQAYSFEDTRSKCISYRERVDEPFVHYTYRPGGVRYAVIVEDWFSAQKVYSAGGLGIALLGTVLNRDRVEELKQYTKGLQLIVALDRDAYNKSIKYALDYGGEFSPPLKVWRLKQDLKYVSVEIIKRHLNGGNGDFIGGSAEGTKHL